MFGMGFTEIMMIAVVAILFLGPDKLPEAMVQIGKFIYSFKKTINEAKSTLEEEINIRELKEEALSYRQTLQEVSNDISGFKHSLPNPVEEVREAFQSAKLEESSGKWEDFDDKFEDLSEEHKEIIDKKKEVISSQKASESSKGSVQVTEPEKNEELSRNEEERPATFKNLSGENAS